MTISGTGVEDDILGKLLLARDEDGKGMNDEDLIGQVLTVMLAGHEVSWI